MALIKKQKTVSLSAYSGIEKTLEDGSKQIMDACYFLADIKSDDPENMNISRSIMDKDVYKENRAAAMRDQTVFEDEAYALQDAMLAENNKTEVTK